MRWLLLLLLIGISPPIALSQDDQGAKAKFAQLNQQMRTHLSKDEKRAALAVANEILELARRIDGPDSVTTAIAYGNVGSILRSLEKNKEALQHFLNALAIREKTATVDSKDKLDLMLAVGACQYDLDRFDDARTTYQKVGDLMKEKKVGSPSTELLVLLGLARSSARAKDEAAANSHFLESLKFAYEHFPLNSEERESVIINRACLLGRGPGLDKEQKAFDDEMKRLNDEEASKGVQHGKALRLGKPEYPRAARANGAAGAAYVRLIIATDGRVKDAIAVCSDSLLGGAAINAAKSSLFSPTLVNGSPVEVKGFLSYYFVLPRN